MATDMVTDKPKLINEKNVIIMLTITVLILVLLAANANTKLKAVLQENEKITSSIEDVNSKVATLGQKMLAAISGVSRQRSELEELRRKLTQERLKNVELQGELEDLRSVTGGSTRGRGSIT